MGSSLRFMLCAGLHPQDSDSPRGTYQGDRKAALETAKGLEEAENFLEVEVP